MRQMSDRKTKDSLFDQFARIGKALSSGRRVEIVDVLANGERTVESIAIQIGLSVANASQHLQVLRRAGIVSGRREGTSIYYSLADPDVFTLWRQLQNLASKQLGDVNRLAEEYLGVSEGEDETVSAEELSLLLRRRRKPVVLDVRPPEEYTKGHIPGALSVPVQDLHASVHQIPKNKDVVVYCRGPFCAYAPEAAAFLKRKGYKVRRLVDGLPDWEAAGRPVETGEPEEDLRKPLRRGA